MKLKRKITGLLLLTLLLNGRLLASNDSSQYKLRPMLGFSLTHVFFKGIKLDGMLPLGQRTLLYLSPEMYNGQLNWEEVGKLKGGGGNLGIRYVFWKESDHQKVTLGFAHLSYGLSQFRINLQDYVWVDQVQNGQNVIVRNKTDVYKQYRRQSIDFLLGLIWRGPSQLYFEANMGVSSKTVRRTFSANYTPTYLNDKYSWSYGYSGVVPQIGFRIGYMFR
ncbi:MAG: hypothetical protein GC180_00470 [Bacteroidetes bacterium]|nr:hypothetical protein [Bacteroidota bacterium]